MLGGLVAALLVSLVPVASADWPQFHHDAARTGSAGTNGKVTAKNVAGLVKRRSFASGGAIDNAPVAAGGVVYFGSFDGSAYALSASTGKQLWKYPIGGTVEEISVDRGLAFVTSSAGGIYAVDAKTGT